MKLSQWLQHGCCSSSLSCGAILAFNTDIDIFISAFPCIDSFWLNVLSQQSEMIDLPCFHRQLCIVYGDLEEARSDMRVPGMEVLLVSQAKRRLCDTG